MMKLGDLQSSIVVMLRKFDDGFRLALTVSHSWSAGQGQLLPDHSQPSAANRPVTVITSHPLVQPQEIILLVDDDLAVRVMTTELLQEAGYVVFPFGSGTEAVHYARQHPYNFDLLMADVVMPELNGVAVVKALHAIRPELPVLLLSGYLEQVPDELLRLPKVSALLKPYAIRELLRRVRALLDQA